ncbi:MAG TPA: TonB family protein [Candidatus Angelobacter sp.]|nr:TonB family protein [Candidatus Angelobacter sp.]
MEEQGRPAEGQRRAEEAPLKVTAVEMRLHLLTADLPEEEDVVSSYRRREAAWISLITHALIIALLILIPKWSFNRPVIVPIHEKQETTFIPLPDDLLKVKPPKTDVISDKNRIAQTRTPTVDKETLRKLIDARNPGPPQPSAAPPPGQQAMQQNPATAQAPVPEVQKPPQTTAQLQAPAPAAPKKSPFAIASPGASVSQAIQSVAEGHGAATTEFGGGEYGSGIRPKVDTRGGLEIMSDTMGVDFGPYMKRLRYTVQSHWDPLIPESALPPIMRKGVVVVEFSITKDGRVMGMKLISGSGDVSLDRAAWAAITDAIPLPNLPKDFAGDYLQIRARFYYNPDKNDLE